MPFSDLIGSLNANALPVAIATIYSGLTGGTYK